MNAVHNGGYLHNDLSPDNIMFHFPEDESKVYIGICDWGLSTLMAHPMKSLYVFTKEEEQRRTLAARWWVDPDVAYLHKRGQDVEAIPYLSRASEEYTVCSLARRIANKCMSEEYFQIPRPTSGFGPLTADQLGQLFDQYLERPTKKGEGYRGGLAHIIHRFTAWCNWPIPDRHFRASY